MNNYRERRAVLGISGPELAAEADIHENSVYAIERGRPALPATRRRIEAALDRIAAARLATQGAVVPWNVAVAVVKASVPKDDWKKVAEALNE